VPAQVRYPAGPTVRRRFTGSALRSRRFRVPATIDDYLPDRREPIDRWYQAENSSNVRTTLHIIAELAPARPSLILDPFAGAGSAAVAARSLGVPFFGVDADPILTCVTIAKTFATGEHIAGLLDRPRLAVDTDDVVLNCLNLIRRIRAANQRPLDLADMATDLVDAGAPHPQSQVFWGDATNRASWSAVPVVAGRKLIYCSPPFGVSSPRPVAPPSLVEDARRILIAADRCRVERPPTEFGSYSDLAAGMLRQAREHLDVATVIMEYEPPDSKVDRRMKIARRLRQEIGADIDQVFVTQAFSARGELSLIRGELRREAHLPEVVRRRSLRSGRA